MPSMLTSTMRLRTSLSDCPTCVSPQVAPDSSAQQLESNDSAELLIPAPQLQSEAPPVEAEEVAEVDEQLHVVVPDAGHLSGRRSFVEVSLDCGNAHLHTDTKVSLQRTCNAIGLQDVSGRMPFAQCVSPHAGLGGVRTHV